MRTQHTVTFIVRTPPDTTCVVAGVTRDAMVQPSEVRICRTTSAVPCSSAVSTNTDGSTEHVHTPSHAHVDGRDSLGTAAFALDFVFPRRSFFFFVGATSSLDVFSGAAGIMFSFPPRAVGARLASDKPRGLAASLASSPSATPPEVVIVCASFADVVTLGDVSVDVGVDIFVRGDFNGVLLLDVDILFAFEAAFEIEFVLYVVSAVFFVWRLGVIECGDDFTDTVAVGDFLEASSAMGLLGLDSWGGSATGASSKLC